MISQRPGPHRFPDDGYVIAQFFSKKLDCLNHALHVRMFQKIRRNSNIVDILPDRLSHFNGGPVVFLFPLNLATQSRRFLDNAKDRHHTIETQLGVPGRGQAGHGFRNSIGIRKWGIHQIHEFHGGNRGWIANRRLVYGFPAQSRQNALPPGHGRNGLIHAMHLILLYTLVNRGSALT